MLTRDEKRLQIFENFVVDENLPKFKTKEAKVVMTTARASFVGEVDFNVPTISVNGDYSDFVYKNGVLVKKKPPLKERLHYLFKGYLKKDKQNPVEPPKSPVPEISIDEFFKSIKNNSKELAKIEKRTESYIEAMKHADAMGQIALKEKLEAQLDVVRAETQLYASGFQTVLEEEQVIEFYKKSEKGIRLDYIKNFTRIIPSNFLATKNSLDEKCIFDNYAIMHYDKNIEGYALTHKEQEEAEKAKDPILFGLISGSRKLYYIGDWVDEYCDLTLEKFIDEFGKAAINKNNITATIKINKDV